MERQKKQNYQREMDELIETLTGEGLVPSLFLHACCAPCSSYVLEYLSRYFRITLFYYNPNIFPAEEYAARVREVKRLLESLPAKYPVRFEEGTYDPDSFFRAVRGHEQDPERGERCTICYRMRLSEAARLAAEGGYDYFTTTLSISPLKDAGRLNAIGDEEGKRYGVQHLHADFKKKDGYRRSIELSKEYGLYRQNYCGCIFSKQEADMRERRNLHVPAGGI
ncbi:MAG: epoxyqueuosine reductase QueH [Clostridium sp.]|nr:epoxyqueuosine reductase QueH [Clostridium sp.]